MALSPFGSWHFLEPAWLFALPPFWAFTLWCARRRGRGGWSALIDPELLPALRLEEAGRAPSPWPLVALGWTCAVLALAGPAFERAATAAARTPPDWVLELDLSPTMEAKDLAPSRVARARFALADLLHAARDARVALIVFAGEAHVVTPLTTDIANVGALLQPLSPSLMPESGHALAPALDAALQLLRSGASRGGAVVVLTDGCDDWPAALAAAGRLRAAGGILHVVGVGTEAGAPQTDGAGGFLRDAQGGTVLTRLPAERLERVAREGGGDYVALDGVPALIAELQRPRSPLSTGGGSAAGLKVEAWRNAGYWLLLPLLLIVASLARRGWL